MTNLFFLIALFFGHFLGDFTPLATGEMHAAKANGSPVFPIVKHALVHAVLVGLMLLIMGPTMELGLALVAFEFVTHFLIDLVKGQVMVRSEKLRDNTTYPYWILFGFDQFLHAVVLIVIYGYVVGLV